MRVSPSLVLALTALPGIAHAADADPFARALEQGPLSAGLAAFVSGLLVSLTPCVYPMVAVTVSVFGARQAKGRLEGLALSAAFVGGIIAMFVPLGVVAGLSGSLAGAALSSRWVVVGISALFVAMAAAMFGAFELDIPEGLKNRLAQVGGTGPLGAFVLGLACGPIAAPCTGPFLTGILAFIARTQSATLGALAMGAFALGLGVPFFLVGAFAVQLPKSGRWMLHVKSVLGLVLLVLAVWFLNNAFGFLGRVARPTTGFLAAAAGALVLGLFLGAVHRSFEGEPGERVRKGLGVLLTVAGAALFLAGATTPARPLTWSHVPAEEARAKAALERRPLIVDFGAAWCGACKELDKITFADEGVQREAGRFDAVKVDATDDEDPVVAAALAAFSVRGLPTVVVYDSSGAETARFTDFVEPSEFLEALRRVN